MNCDSEFDLFVTHLLTPHRLTCIPSFTFVCHHVHTPRELMLTE
jgi:hypothetical protein